jgi:hypothetical protein
MGSNNSQLNADGATDGKDAGKKYVFTGLVAGYDVRIHTGVSQISKESFGRVN